MVSRLHLTTIFLIAVGVWAAFLYLQGTSLSLTLFSPFNRVLTIVAALLAVFDKWGWRWRVFRGWFVHIPDLNGLWNGRFESTWIDPQTRQPAPPTKARVIVKQTYSAIHLRLETDESDSELLSGGLVRKSDGSYQVAGVYRGTPRLLKREGSPIHYGGLLLSVVGNPPTALRGEYWTDRRTQGELDLRRES